MGDFRQAGSIRKGEYCMLSDQPCKILEIAVSKPGKHGAAKACMTGINIFTDKKVHTIYATSATVKVPIVKKIELEVVDIAEDDYVTFLLPNNTLKEDLNLPTDKEHSKEFKASYETNKEDSQVFFTIISACSQERIVSTRVAKIRWK